MPPRRTDFSSRPRPRTIVEVDTDDDDDDDFSCGSYDGSDDERFPLRKLPTPEELLQELSTNDDEDDRRAVFGRWRDSLWGDFVRHGYCHASVLTACCCCTPCAAGQIATRLHLTPITAQPVTTKTVAKAAVFRTIVQWCVAYWLTRLGLLLLIAILDPNTFSESDNDNRNNSSEQWIEPGAGYYFLCAVDDLLAWMYVLVCAVQLRNVRRTVRQKYQIPPAFHYCGPDAEDATCALLCPCLVAAQMLRHTADYEVERAAPFPCASPTGLAAASSSVL